MNREKCGYFFRRFFLPPEAFRRFFLELFLAAALPVEAGDAAGPAGFSSAFAGAAGDMGALTG